MKKLFLSLILLATPSFAQAKDPEKCIACVTAKQRAMVQKKLDDLRARVKELEDELAKKPTHIGVPVQRTVEKVVQVKEERRPWRLSLAGGILPDGVHGDSGLREREAKIHEDGFGVGGGVQYKFENHVSVGAIVIFATRDTHTRAGAGMISYDL